MLFRKDNVRNKKSTYIDIILIYESQSSSLGRCSQKLVYTSICLTVLPHTIHQVQAQTHEQSNLFWVNLKCKHPCNSIPLFFSEFMDTHRHSNRTIVGRYGLSTSVEW